MSRQVEEVADLLHSAAIHRRYRAQEQDRPARISPARLSALSVVVFRGPLTLGELAAAERVRSATMSGIVNGLESEGLEPKRIQQALEYYDEFYKTINDPGRTRQEFIRSCPR